MTFSAHTALNTVFGASFVATMPIATLLLASPIVVAAWASAHSVPVAARARCAVATMKIGATAREAQQQQDVLFALAPWEKMPKFDLGGRPTTLDTRAFIKPFDRGGVTLAPIFANQEGLNVSPRRRIVGIVAVEGEDESKLSASVSRQRALIEAWACELIREYKTGRKLLAQGEGAPPIELAWASKPNRLRKIVEPAYQGEMHEVPRDAPADESLRCGFVGSSCYSIATKTGFRFESVVLPD